VRQGGARGRGRPEATRWAPRACTWSSASRSITSRKPISWSIDNEVPRWGGWKGRCRFRGPVETGSRRSSPNDPTRTTGSTPTSEASAAGGARFGEALGPRACCESARSAPTPAEAAPRLPPLERTHGDLERVPAIPWCRPRNGQPPRQPAAARPLGDVFFWPKPRASGAGRGPRRGQPENEVI